MLMRKVLGLVSSKRWFTSLIAGMVATWGGKLGLDDETTSYIVQLLIALIAGDTIRPLSVLSSRRFWITAASIIGFVFAQNQVEVDPAALQSTVLAVAAFVLGDSWREMEPKALFEQLE